MKKVILVFLIIPIIIVFSQFALARGEWQTSIHYGSWSLRPAEAIIEGFIRDTLQDSVRGLIEEYSGIIDPDGDYSQSVEFGSSGKNLALEFRFYPGGEDGSFSIGLAAEKSELEIILDCLATYELADGSYVDGSGSAVLLWQPTSYHLSFRWDLMPSWQLHPYIGFGAGIASFKGVLTYEATVETYDASTATTTIEITFDEIDLEFLEYTEPKITPLVVQLNLGFSLEVTKNLYFLLDAGIWNGFLVRGGVCLRV
ncbi:hypothetical protein CEE34_02155 [Candidatus Aerophobetes bacterium Ae_b3a]|nr:MAG: hypothetical protein CEE34_02155 [Candidatus Aerophobetes bacterium Ae_b3a]